MGSMRRPGTKTHNLARPHRTANSLERPSSFAYVFFRLCDEIRSTLPEPGRGGDRKEGCPSSLLGVGGLNAEAPCFELSPAGPRHRVKSTALAAEKSGQSGRSLAVRPLSKTGRPAVAGRQLRQRRQSLDGQLLGMQTRLTVWTERLPVGAFSSIPMVGSSLGTASQIVGRFNTQLKGALGNLRNPQ